MASQVTVKNTLTFLFPADAAQPAVADMVRFVKSLNGDKTSMETAYKISDEKSVFIRFKSVDAMHFVLANNEELLPFCYTNGKKVMVRMSVAGNTRYVRIFDLPPEVPDADLVSVMEKFGKVKRTVRERFPAEFQLEMFAGVRGLYMNIETEIPDVLRFRNWKGRIYYDGIKLKCFTCKSNTHLKRLCPILRERQSAASERRPGVDTLKGEPASEVTIALDQTEVSSVAVPQKKKNKSENKRQRSIDLDRDSDSACEQTQKKKNTNNASSSESKNNVIAVPDISPGETRHRISTYDWLPDENERQLLIEEDKQRIATATNTPLDRIIFYHDELVE